MRDARESVSVAEDRKRKKQGKREQNRKTVLLIAGLVFCALLVIIGINVMFHMTISKYDPDIIISGVSIGGTDVSGMNAAQAEAAVKKSAEEYASQRIVLKLDGARSAEAALTEFGMSVADLDSAIRDALDYGKEGNPITCYKILKSAEKNENKKEFSIRYEVTAESAGAVLEEKLGALLIRPTDAKLTQRGGETLIEEDVPGEKIDVKKTVANINSFIAEDQGEKDNTVSVKTEEAEADIKAEDLEGIKDVLGTFTTYYGESDDGRTMNVESGANHIDGTLVRPGEEVSADDLMAPYTEENGYAMAASYENNEVVESMGGGICQVSTTLYNALLMAELEITERYEHSMLVSYVEPSMDAAIADDVKDLKFRNNMETPVYIEAVLSEGNITFNIYGKEVRPEGRKVEYISESLETVESDETRYVATEDPIGTIYTRDNGHNGLKAQLWKVVCEDGAEVSREAVNYSTYLASGKTVAVGTFSESEEASAKINAAIETQDEAQINAVIAEVSAGETQESEDSGEESSGGGSAGGEN